MNPPDPPIRRSSSYADAVRGQRVFAPKSKPAQDTQKQPSETKRHGQELSPKSRSKFSRDRKTDQGLERKTRFGKDSSSAPSQPRLPPLPEDSLKPSQAKAHMPAEKSKPRNSPKRAHGQKSSYAQALLGRKPLVPLKPLKDRPSQSAATETVFPRGPSSANTVEAKEPATSKPPQSTWKQSDDARKRNHVSQQGSRDRTLHQGSLESQPQRQHAVAPADNTNSTKPKDKQKTHQHQISSASLGEASVSLNQNPLGGSGLREPLSIDPDDSSMAVDQKRTRSYSTGDDCTPAPDFIDARIQKALEAEALRLEIVRQRAIRTAEAIQRHDKGEFSLFDVQYEWDVEIICRGTKWRVHHDILSRECEWFRERLPPKDSYGGYIRFDLSGHQPHQLGHALKFMYTHSYPKAKYTRQYPLNGESIRVNTFMYICAASIGYTRMMRYATDHIDEATDILAEVLPRYVQSDGRGYLQELVNLYDPLGFAFAMMYDQGSKPVMLGLRLAMALLVDTALMHLILDRGFKRAFELAWVNYIYPNLVNDAIWFRNCGLLGPPKAAPLLRKSPPDRRRHDHDEERRGRPWGHSWAEQQSRLKEHQARLSQNWRNPPPKEQPSLQSQSPVQHPPQPRIIQNSIPKAEQASKSVADSWGVWDAATWDNIERDKKGRNMSYRHSMDARAEEQSQAFTTNAHALDTNTRSFHTNMLAGTRAMPADLDSVSWYTGSWAEQEEEEEVVEDEEGNLWTIGAPIRSRPTEEDHKRPRSVSDHLANPWDAESWRPQTENKEPTQDEDDHSTITTYTPVTSMAGDEVSGSTAIPLVFNEENNDTESVTVTDGEYAPTIITDMTKEKEAGHDRGTGDDGYLPVN
ncbi:hypothetical protein QBC35DRAFT_275312 [Podospora australis]|uniref:BTB domain-containing protein n=1 Tax=Podospora australis TaxID=1536484 RepID=A0AAN6X2J5_9PEZI|nr:hypothetical protein QBC35DRAFT_275312 [Podospora australis]